MTIYSSRSIIPDTVNSNGRLYSRAVLEDAVDDLKLRISFGNIITGMLDGTDPETRAASLVDNYDMDKVAFFVTKVELTDAGLVTEIDVPNVPNNAFYSIIKGSIDHGIGYVIGPVMIGCLDEDTGFVTDVKIMRMDLYLHKGYAWDVEPMKEVQN